MARLDKLPSDSCLNGYVSPSDYMDTFSVSLVGREDLVTVDIRKLADQMLMADINWLNALLSLRDRVVKPLGLKTTADLRQDQKPVPLNVRQPGDRVGFFKIYELHANEILLGEDDRHQDFRLSVYRESGPVPRLYASTCCKRHNLFGHAYLALILPFHKQIAKTVLDAVIENRLEAA
ncbi:MAG: DUF2867 domain-containing protein [Roseibium sp.]